jgi:hypothetical protein
MIWKNSCCDAAPNRPGINPLLTKKHGIAFVFQRDRQVPNDIAPVSCCIMRAWGGRPQRARNEGLMTNSPFRGAGFTPPVRSTQALRLIALPQFLALMTLIVCTAAVLMAVSWSVASKDKRAPVPVSSNVQSQLL